MTPEQRFDYVDLALRINNVQLSERILKTTLACIDLIDKTKGKVYLDQCLKITSKQ